EISAGGHKIRLNEVRSKIERLPRGEKLTVREGGATFYLWLDVKKGAGEGAGPRPRARTSPGARSSAADTCRSRRSTSARPGPAAPRGPPSRPDARSPSPILCDAGRRGRS